MSDKNPANKAADITKKFINKAAKFKNIIFYAVFIFIIIAISIVFSESYRVNKCVKQMDIYKEYIVLNSKLNSEELRERRLCDFYIASSYRSCVGINQRFDYVSIQILASVIKSGARMLWLDIFNQTMNTDTQPVISNGTNMGNWKYTLNTVHLDDAIKTIAKMAFSSGYVNNYNDPLILALNLNVQNNIATLNKIKRILIKHLKPRLLPSRYGFLSKNIAEIKIKELLGKVIIISSGGYMNSDLTEIINYSWNKPELRLISYKSIADDNSLSSDIILDKSEVKDFNTNNLTIVLPEENSIFTQNYDTSNAFNTGCQLVCMNYQLPDSLMDEYVSKFKESSFIERPEKFAGKSYSAALKLSKSEQESLESSLNECKRCPQKPGISNRYVDQSAFTGEKHIYKKESDTEGLCFFSNETCDDKLFVQHDTNSLGLIIGSDQVGFPKGKDKIEHGSDINGNNYKVWKPKLCCAKKKFLDPKDKYVISPQCSQPSDLSGYAGLKITDNTINNVSGYTKGINEDNFTWIKPTLCKISDEKILRNQKYCTLSTNTCPDSWSGNIDLENGWKMCCKN